MDPKTQEPLTRETRRADETHVHRAAGWTLVALGAIACTSQVLSESAWQALVLLGVLAMAAGGLLVADADPPAR